MGEIDAARISANWPNDRLERVSKAVASGYENASRDNFSRAKPFYRKLRLCSHAVPTLMRTCSYCGRESSDEAAACRECGTPFESERHTELSAPSLKGSQKSKLPLIVFVGTLALLALAGFWSHLSYDGDSSSSPTVLPSAGTNSASIPKTDYPLPSMSAEVVHSLTKGVMRVIVSLAVLAASLFVILQKKYNANDKKWAYGSVGAILGFWLGG